MRLFHAEAAEKPQKAAEKTQTPQKRKDEPVEASEGFTPERATWGGARMRAGGCLVYQYPPGLTNNVKRPPAFAVWKGDLNLVTRWEPCTPL